MKKNLWNFLYFSLAVISITTGFVFAYFNDHITLAISIFLGIFLLLMANVEKFESFKVSERSFEAKIRDIYKRAENTLSELQLLALSIAQISLSLLNRQGRIGAYNDNEKEQLKNNILSTLGKIGINDESFQNILKEWNEIIIFDYCHHILGGSRVPATKIASKITKWKELRDHDFKNTPQPETIRNFLNETNLTNEGIEDYLTDYEYFIKEQRHRRPLVWENRENWGYLKEKSS